MRWMSGFCAPLAVLLALAADFGGSPLHAQDAAKTAPAKDPKDEKPATGKNQLLTRSLTATIGDRELNYEVTTGTLAVKTDEGKPRANIFFIAYTVKPEPAKPEPAKPDHGKPEKGKPEKGNKPQPAAKPRPVTFCFNGGPGSSSVWLHMGMLGPKRVKLNSDASPNPPPHQVIDNPYSLLDVTDLVFIDPVSTGFSRPAEGVEKQQFHGYEQDIRSVGEFIYLYVSQFERWGSPRFLCGESYGTMRAAGLAGHLQNAYNMELNGLLLISSVIDFQTIRFGETNDLPYILFLPSYAATAWYHQRLSKDLQEKSLEELQKEVDQFAATDYTLALMAGSSLPEEKFNQVAKRLASYTGLSEEFVRRADLRISMSRFAKELLRAENRTVGRFDSRYQGIDRDAVGESSDYDPSASGVFGAFTSAVNQYLREELDFEREQVYEILTGKVHPWSYDSFENRYVSAAETLRQAMVKNPSLKVFVGNGYFDLATPYFATIYSFNHLGLPKELQENVEMAFYEGGHMMYVHEPSLVKLKEDLVKFYDRALKQD